MSDYLSEFLGGAALLLLVVALLFGFVFIMADSFGEFEYRPVSGQTGTAGYCTSDYGQARCRTADGEVVMVEQYRKVK